jgi:hypothetical protein
VLTVNCLRLAAASRHAACFCGAATLSVMTLIGILSAAHADGMAQGGCVGGTGALNCVVRWGEAGDPYVRIVPPPANDVERTRSAERDRKWQQHCQPIIMQDRYGVARYRYSAPGCEFGVIE